MLIRSQYIKNDLTTKFSLVLGIKDKATCSVTDLFNPLHYHWCQDADRTVVHGRYRVQTAFLMQLIAYTSSRPGAIIEPNCYKGFKVAVSGVGRGASQGRHYRNYDKVSRLFYYTKKKL